MGAFVWDDVPLIAQQPIVHEFQPIGSYFDRMFFGGPAGAPTRTFYRPLVTLSFALDWKVWDGSPLGFHLTNLLLHLVCVTLVFLVARRWGARPVAATLACAAFGLLPRLTEAVAWISGRTDLLAASFVLASLAIHGPSSRRRWASAFLLLLGLLSKEAAVAGIAGIVALEATDDREAPDRRWARFSPLLIVTVVYALLRYYAEATSQAPPRVPHLNLDQRILVALEAIGTYVWMLVDPLRPRTQIGSIFVRSWPTIALGAMFLFGAGVATWRWRSKAPRTGWAWASAALVLVPLGLVLHAVPLPLQVVAADRFLYLPAAALAIGLAVWAARWEVRSVIIGAVAAAVLVPAAGVATYVRTLDWRDEASLWTDAAAHAPAGNSLPFVQLGIALCRLDRPEEALPALDRAQEIDDELAMRGLVDPMGSGSREARAFALAALGRFDEASRAFEELAVARPSEPVYGYNLGVTRAMALDFGAARRQIENLLLKYPDYEDARNYLKDITRIEAAWRALPVDASADDPGTTMARAEIFAELGRGRDAARLWKMVLANEAAAPTLRQEAGKRLSR